MNWQTGKITGSKDTIAAKVGESKIPQNIKDYILSEVATLPEGSSIISVTGYSADHANPMHKESVTRNIQITISAASL